MLLRMMMNTFSKEKVKHEKSNKALKGDLIHQGVQRRRSFESNDNAVIPFEPIETSFRKQNQRVPSHPQVEVPTQHTELTPVHHPTLDTQKGIFLNCLD